MDKPTNGVGIKFTEKMCRNSQFIKINSSTVKLTMFAGCGKAVLCFSMSCEHSYP